MPSIAAPSLRTRFQQATTRPAPRWPRAALLALGLLALSGPAQAVFHLMKIVEIFRGTAASPNAQYVVLQMYASGQNLVSGHDLVVFNAAGAPVATFTFTSNVSNGANQARILIATPQAASFFNVTPDLTMSAALIAAGGKVCFADTIDCAAWGNYSGSPTGVGTPFNASAGGLRSGRAMIRRLDIAGSPTVLDAGDDTANCAVDFVSGLPQPRNNAGVVGSIPGATCGNNVIEGLEECDDGNLSNADTCSSTCTVQAAPPARAVGDYNGDGRSDLFWRNAQSGANVLWRSASSATQTPLATVADGNWRVVGRGEFNGDANTDVFWRNLATGANDVWRSANSATRTATPAVPAAWQVVAVGDFNGDGRGDIFWRNSQTGANELWRSGVPSGRLPLAAVALAWRVVGAGDFNGDRRSDVFWRNTSTGANAIWLSAQANTQQATATVAAQSWRVAGIGDFTGDGRDDVVWRNATSGANDLWRSGSAAQRLGLYAVTNLAWNIADVGDYNGDRKADLFWRNTSTGQNAIWLSANVNTQQAASTVANLQWSTVPRPGQ